MCESIPICTICYEKNNNIVEPEKVIINFDEVIVESPIYQELYWRIVVEGSITFDESIMATEKTVKIPFREKQHSNAWKDYFELLLFQNPIVKKAQAHFYNEEFNFPFMIGMSIDRKLMIEIYETNNVLYTKVNLDANIEEEFPFSFDKEMYIQVLHEHPAIFKLIYNPFL